MNNKRKKKKKKKKRLSLPLALPRVLELRREVPVTSRSYGFRHTQAAAVTWRAPMLPL
jgi:hypothetical protein